MRHRYRLAVTAILLLCASSARAQSAPKPSNGLIFGTGTLMSGPTKPTAGQAICNVNGVLAGCAGGGGGGAPACTGSVTLNSSGVGAFTNPCVTTASVCTVSYTSPTSYNNPITTNAPTNGGITLYNGVANLTVQVKC